MRCAIREGQVSTKATAWERKFSYVTTSMGEIRLCVELLGIGQGCLLSIKSKVFRLVGRRVRRLLSWRRCWNLRLAMRVRLLRRKAKRMPERAKFTSPRGE